MAIVGIDLGTRTASWRLPQRRARPPPERPREPPDPSVVGLDDDGQVLVGQAAKERLITHPGLTVAAFKRFMGRTR